jgi:hypothetical protein
MLSYQRDVEIAVLSEHKAGRKPRHATTRKEKSVGTSVCFKCTDPTTTIRFLSPIFVVGMRISRAERERWRSKA